MTSAQDGTGQGVGNLRIRLGMRKTRDLDFVGVRMAIEVGSMGECMGLDGQFRISEILGTIYFSPCRRFYSVY